VTNSISTSTNTFCSGCGSGHTVAQAQPAKASAASTRTTLLRVKRDETWVMSHVSDGGPADTGPPSYEDEPDRARILLRHLDIET
jgi:hypothetical protein